MQRGDSGLAEARFALHGGGGGGIHVHDADFAFAYAVGGQLGQQLLTGDLAAALSAALSGVETKAEEERFCSGDRCEMKRPA